MKQGYATTGYGKLRSVLLCKPTFYEFMPVNETAKSHLEKGERLDRERAFREHQNLADAVAGGEGVAEYQYGLVRPPQGQGG